MCLPVCLKGNTIFYTFKTIFFNMTAICIVQITNFLPKILLSLDLKNRFHSNFILLIVDLVTGAQNKFFIWRAWNIMLVILINYMGPQNFSNNKFITLSLLVHKNILFHKNSPLLFMKSATWIWHLKWSDKIINCEITLF